MSQEAWLINALTPQQLAAKVIQLQEELRRAERDRQAAQNDLEAIRQSAIAQEREFEQERAQLVERIMQTEKERDDLRRQLAEAREREETLQLKIIRLKAKLYDVWVLAVGGGDEENKG